MAYSHDEYIKYLPKIKTYQKKYYQLHKNKSIKAVYESRAIQYIRKLFN